jgi:2'-5' RNA ligase
MRNLYVSALRSIITKLNGTYDSSSLQVELPEDLAKAIIAWGRKNIPDENLHDNEKDTKGREDEIHITLLYGLTSPEPDDKVKEIIASTEPFKVRLGLVTLFRDKPDYDVVKIESESAELQRLHYAIENAVEVNNEYPTYQSHCTIAYVKKGTADDLNGDETFKGKMFTIDEITFSSLNGNKIPITLKKE